MPDAFICSECGCQNAVDGRPGLCRRCSSDFPPMSGAWKSKALGVAMSVCFLLVVAALVLPSLGSAKESAKRAKCRNNLKQIGLALLNYQSQYGAFPPAYVADAYGRPVHSWRVLILPFLGYPDLYVKYEFNLPWNSKHNLKLALQMPEEFRCPGANKNGIDKTTYVAASGPGYFFDREHCRTQSEIRDGMSKTLTVLDDARRELVWLDPSDGLVAVDATSKFDGNVHPNGMCVLMADGSVHFLTPEFGGNDFAKLLTVAGCEPVGDGMD